MPLLLQMKTARGDGGRAFSLTRAITVIGRSHRCHLRMALPSVAMHHCEILLEGGRATAVNHGPAGSVLLNGHAIDSSTLSPGDLLQIASVQFVVAGISIDSIHAPQAHIETKPLDGNRLEQGAVATAPTELGSSLG